MSSRQYPHRVSFQLLLGKGADERAPGGAVTVALCGHWDHEGPCKWPHFSAIAQIGQGLHRLVTDFDAPDQEVAEVRERIEAGLRIGRLIGPDGHESTWVVVD